MKHLLPLLMALLLCGCTFAATPENTLRWDPIDAGTETPAPTPEAAAPTTEPAVIYRDPLNGAVLDAPFTGRVVAFMVGNTDDAHPQYGIAQADILYEMPAEGGATRCMPLYSDLSKADAVGSIRTARTCFISTARAYDAVLLHSGAYDESIQVDAIDNINGDPTIFYQDAQRLSSGYGAEHCLFANTAKAQALLADTFDMIAPANAGYGLQFADGQTLRGEAAGRVLVNFGTDYAKATGFFYDEAAGNYRTYRYTQSMEEMPWVAGETGDALRFENLLILHAVKTPAPGKDVRLELVGSGEGYYVSGGRQVSIRWSRKAEDMPFTYTLADGSPLTLIPGKTYIAIVPTGSPVEFE